MKARNIIAATILFWAAGNLGAANTLKLEHTFDGYYMPHNMVLQAETDDARYFYPFINYISTGTINIKTYNENYSVRDNISMSFTIPSGYVPSSATFSSSFEMSDGTKFLIVTFSKNDGTYGSSDHYIANAYNVKTGKLITTIGKASGSVSAGTTLYSINGKKSLLVIELNTGEGKTDYKTKIYSFAEAPSYTPALPCDPEAPVVPVITVDLAGRPVSEPMPGTITVTRMSDGSTVKKMN